MTQATVTNVTADPWHVDSLDLAAYLARIGQPERPPSLEALGDLQRAHVETFPFENLDVLLESHPGVDLDDVQAKFVERGRGGYCFEHATLFAAATARLGYRVTRLLGRVGDPHTAARSHLVVVVELDGDRWLCDPGIGRPPLAPIRLADGATDSTGGWRHRIRAVADGPVPAWALERWEHGQWELMHTTDELPVRPVDVAMSHHYTSTHPDSHFRRSLMVARHGRDPGGDARAEAVTLDGVTTRRPGTTTQHRPLALAELPDLVRALGAAPTDDEMARLVTVVAGLGH